MAENGTEKVPPQNDGHSATAPIYPSLSGGEAEKPLIPQQQQQQQQQPAYPMVPSNAGVPGPPAPPGYMPLAQGPVMGAPIMTQPGIPMQPILGQQQTTGWMPVPQGIPNCPPGLEYLTSIDQLLVHQKVELLEAFTGFETANKYTVMNTLGQKVYWALEDTGCCNRMCCGTARAFDIKILDNFQNEVLHFSRGLRCKSCCFPCCLQKLEVSAPPGNVIGTVEQQWTLFCPGFNIKDRDGKTVLVIKGPCCQCTLCGDVKFRILATDGTEVGKVTKQWTGMAQEYFTDADNFGISFPMNLDVRVKATLLGALFLIDYMFFESSGKSKR
ncbi:phospholipid scramblase 2-like isoform X1 [Anopheles darlingi]|uniref:phospholipid scramblase 2-like isoform X1 n=2 Tax=Anopheles darlingi TaxID=43151 RepID=UPI00210045BB|nr:phospholipid scramblase 2-like isoform X1 [Anopheles darlingi]XP_049547179.1 phospholipid scramblase 2-like isoform X1 [Anopheles darlingi]XP_049547181.1 phospholipid scramblase 2-like isoform X1 [Anopheles darlingi]